MHEAPLTQEVIDHGFSKAEDKSGLADKLAKRSLLYGGALLAGGGIVLAAAKFGHKRDDESGHATPRHGSKGH